VEYYSFIKKNEILPFATTWIDLESVMLSEISQSEKDKYRMIFLEFEKQNKRTKKKRGKQTLKYRKQTDGY